MLEVSVKKDTIGIGPHFAVNFQRTLRIPDDGGTYPLPPGLGDFPVFRVEDYADRRISLDLDDGVKVNYGKFGDLLAEVKAVHGKNAEDV